MTIETDINLMEHAGRTWRFVLKNEGGAILPLDNFVIYGAAACPGQAPRAFEVRVDAGVADRDGGTQGCRYGAQRAGRAACAGE